jgi:hypothetical protein
MTVLPRFYRDDAEWAALAEQLPHTPCPHCRAYGHLLQHGFLYGFDERHPQRTTARAHRIFCSNRHAHHGCGRTFSVWLAEKIRRLSLTTHGLHDFLQRAVADGLAAARRAFVSHLSDRTLLRLWKRFRRAQCALRAVLLGRCPPPPAATPPPRPEAQTLAHLHAAFPDADDPLAAFQHAGRTFVV